MWLGIDFGTSNSSAARLVGGHPHAVREPISHQPFFPSCILLPPPNGTSEVRERLLTGVTAERQMQMHPDRFRAELKRNLGEPWPLVLGGEEVPVVDAIGAVIRSLKTEADRMSGGPFAGAMMTVPVAFGAERVALIEDAARAAGFGEVRHCLEPEAAARYHVYATEGGESEELLLVYDFGGGTFDASLVSRTGQRYEIRASDGLDDCGGRDLDRELFAAVLERAKPALRKKLIASQTAGSGSAAEEDAIALTRLRLNTLDSCRRIKHELSVADSSEADVGTPPEAVRFTRKEFEALVAPHIARTIECCDGLIRGQSLTWNDVSRILLVGGTTRIPAIAETLRTRFDRPTNSVDDPELAVSFGASLAFAAPEPAIVLPVEPVPGGGREATVSLQALVDAAAPGTTVAVPPAIYREALRIEKPLALVAGPSERGERAVIEPSDKPALTTASKGVSVTGLAFHTQGADASVKIESGELDMAGCDVWGGKIAALLIGTSSTVTVRGSRLHEGLKNGIHIFGDVRARIEDNDIVGNANAGISVHLHSGNVRVSGNRVGRNKGGILVSEGGPEVQIVGNDVFENTAGIEVIGLRSAPIVRENNAHGNSRSGVIVSQGAGGVVERNEVSGNTEVGIALIGAGTSPLVSDNTVTGNPASGVGVSVNAADGVIFGNRIAGHTAVRLSNDSGAVVRQNEIASANRCVDVIEKGGGLVEENRIVGGGPAATGIFVAALASANVRRNRFEGEFGAFYSIKPNAKSKVFGFTGNRIALRPLVADEALHKLALALERSEWAGADAESIRLIRAALGSAVIKNGEEAAAVPTELYVNMDRLWRLASDEPLRNRNWVKLPMDGVTQISWRGQTFLARHLQDLDL